MNNSIIKVTDTSINVEEIMKSIEEQSKKLDLNFVLDDITYVNNLNTSIDISPIISDEIKQPKSTKKGFPSKLLNKFITKIYFVVINSIGNSFKKQEDINSTLIAKINKIQKQIDVINLDLGINKLPNFDYLGFQNKMRGSEIEVHNRMKKYSKYLKNKKIALDIGCGRGEFIEFAEKLGCKTTGLEINEDMFHICSSKNLDVIKSDGISYLTNEKENTYDLILMSHVIEHLSFPDIIRIIELSFQRLNKDGVLILESPNPTTVATHIGGFYSDPTHKHFAHPSLMHYILEKAGFKGIEIKFESLQSERLVTDDTMSKILKQDIDRLNEIIFGYQDYSLIAIK